MEPMRYGELFAGIGGMSLGLERAGMTPAWFSEIDPYASRVLAKHWPDVPNLGDATRIDWATVPPVDLLCGGFPCQPFSVAGKQLGEADERNLWPEVVRAIRGLRPRLVLMENVPALLSVGYFGTVLGDLAACGYDTEWDCIPAAAVGAPHLRWRVFVMAYPEGFRRERRLSTRSSRGEGHLLEGCGGWPAEPRVGRVADGFSPGLDRDRIRALGNAVVPQVAEWIGRRIMEAYA